MRTGTSVLVMLLLSSACHGLFRGDEYQPRDYNFDPEYYVDVASYQLPRRLLRKFRQADSAYAVTAGSLNSRDMYLFQRLKVTAPCGERLDFGFRYETDQDFEGTYQQYLLRMEADIGHDWCIYGTGAMYAAKELSDLGLGFRYGREDLDLDIMFLWPNLFWDGKNELDSWVERQPGYLQIQGEVPVGPGVLLAQCGLDLPGRYRYDLDAFRFGFEKYRAGLEYEYGEWDGSVLWVGAWLEYADKRRWGYAAGDPEDFSLDRDFGQAQVEYEVWYTEKQALTTGFMWAYMNEGKRYPNDAASTRYILRNDYLTYLTWTAKASDGIWLRTGVYADYVDMDELYPGNPASDVVVEDWRVKVPFMLIFSGENGEFALNVTTQAYPYKFGGYNVMFSLQF